MNKQTILTVIGVAIGVVVAVWVGGFMFLTTSSTTLHKNAQDVPSVSQADPPPRWTDAVTQGRQIARRGLVNQNLPGLSIAVGVDGDIVWAEGFGWADLEKRIPVAPGTRFRIGHASKALTSAAVGVLKEKGRLDLDVEIQKYVPAFPKKEWPVTLRQLMGHVAGIRHYDNHADYMPTARCERADEGLRFFANDSLRFEPGTRHSYSTFGWILVSAAVEAAADQPFFTFMRTQIFEPLGMRDTHPDSGMAPMPERATFYYPRFSGDPATGPQLATAVDYSCFAGAGAFLSTPSDLVRFGSGRLRQGFGAPGAKLLQPATVTALQTAQFLVSGEQTEYGLGWTLETVPLAGEQTRLASHASLTLLGGSTSFMTFPDHGIVVAVTSNISKGSTRAIALQIADAFATRSRATLVRPPSDRRSTSLRRPVSSTCSP